MRIALMHFHLGRGGVGAVIRQQARSLSEAGDEVLVIAGEYLSSGSEAPPDPAEYGGAAVALVPDLSYDAHRRSGGQSGAGNPPGHGRPAAAELSAGAERLAGAVRDAMQRHWGSIADVLHVHNPLVKRNGLLLPALRLLQAGGMRLLLESHDFAEDFRPDLYLYDEAYPEDCHYAALNGRDHSFLRRAGLDPAGTHLLPNAVTAPETVEGRERTRYLYPARALRRKNLGEALLLSLYIPEGRTVAVTLPPSAPRDEAVFRHWRELASRLKLPVEFNLGSTVGLPELYGTAVCALTTSVKEGFGFSYLDPWVAGRAVIGRRLGYVCADFERAGVRFDNSYDSIDVPLVYLPAPQLRRKLEQTLLDAYRAFNLVAPPYALKRLTDDLFSRDVFDFGRLDEELQTEILETLASNPAARDDLAEANPFLANLAGWEPDGELISANRARILHDYAGPASLLRLHAAYKAAIEQPVRHRLSRSILLELFLDPLRFSLVAAGHV
jgi:hypothetical protein